MKKFAITGLLVVVFVVCLWLIWQHVNISRFDRDFSRRLAGSWSWEVENIRGTNMVASDGSFTNQLTFSHHDPTNTYQMAGTWRIKDGRLIETITRDSKKSAQIPRTLTGQIIRVNAIDFVVVWQGSTNQSAWQKVSQ